MIPALFYLSILLTTFSMQFACQPLPPAQGDLPQFVIVAELPRKLNETSGMASGTTPSTILLHNDSGGQPALYEVTTSNGRIVRTIRLTDAVNTDWEELAEDSTHVYVGDFGNNRGTRDNLTIYKLRKDTLAISDQVTPEVISFHYPEQTSFVGSSKHNFDCEAMIAYGDSLYLFTKNRGDLHTDVYRLPKTPGNYAAQHMGRHHTRGLVTAADLLPGETNTLALLGYVITGKQYKAFLWIFDGFTGTDFFGGEGKRIALAPDLQAESVLFTSDSTLLITNEEELRGAGAIYEIRFRELMEGR